MKAFFCAGHLRAFLLRYDLHNATRTQRSRVKIVALAKPRARFCFLSFFAIKVKVVAIGRLLMAARQLMMSCRPAAVAGSAMAVLVEYDHGFCMYLLLSYMQGHLTFLPAYVGAYGLPDGKVRHLEYENLEVTTFFPHLS